MRLFLIQRILGLFLIIFSVALVPPLFVSLIYQDAELLHFLVSLVLVLITGLVLWLPVRHRRADLRRREGFLIVAMFWVVLSALATLPFQFGPHLSFTDSFFEAASAFTTTGATVMVGLDDLPRSLLFYRQELQWLGGMGIIVLAVAILPMLGIGGMQLYRAETPGPLKDDKLTPRIAHSARAFWYLYTGLTVLCALGYWLAGMTPFDAVTHSFSTISTGGFSTHDASFAYFHNPAIEVVAVIFMTLGGINFSIHFIAWHRRNPRHYWRDTEVRTYLIALFAFSLITTLFLAGTPEHKNFLDAFRYATFQVVSVMTSTGYTTENFSLWPLLLPAFLIFISFMGGCAGSTAGGMKVIRVVVLVKQGVQDLRQLVHPTMQAPLKIAGRVLDRRVIDSVWGFFAVYVATFVMFMLVLMANGLDQVTTFSAVATCMNNMGPGLGKVASNFRSVSDMAKWCLAFAMLLGRLEIFTLLVLLSPGFWRN
jgi:trk system potassium uptake protein TrkH